MYKFATAIGIDIGRTMIRTALVRYDGEVLESFNYPYSQLPDRKLLLEYVINAIRSTRNKSADFKVNPLCVGIAAKGFIDYRKGRVIGPDQGIEGWTDVPLSEIVSKEIGLPTYVGNDANLMAIAETSFGIAKGNKNSLFVALRSGIGGALIIDGKLHRGINNSAGEIGQMSINIGGPESKTGVKGSFEYYASSYALVRRYLELADKDKNSNMNSIMGLRAKDVFELSYKGDKSALEAVSENAAYVGVGLANLVSIFAPDMIILGGGMALAKESYLDSIRKSVRDNTLEYCSKDLRIERASLGYLASLMGSSLFALTRLDGKNI